MTICPKCGNKQALDRQHMVFYPWATKEESDRKNYAGSQCQMCGHKWDKHRGSARRTIKEGEV